MRQAWPWHYFYLSNFYFVAQGSWTGVISHFWTLAVEEQFYLIWPWVVLLVSNKRLPMVLWLVVASAPLYRAAGDIWFPHIALWDKATPGSFDSLGLGALLAWYRRNGMPHISTPAAWGIAAVGVAGYFVTGPFALTMLCVAFVLLINACAIGVGGPFGALCNWAPLLYLGRISYGLYIFHNIIPVLGRKILAAIPVLDALPLSGVAVFTVLTVIIAALSWHLYEGPINEFKRLFPYVKNTSNQSTLPRV